MERRHCTRVPVSVPVIIFNQGLPIASGITRDVSAAGMFVWTDAGELDQQAELEIQCAPVAPSSPVAARSYPRVQAQLVRSQDDGLGLSLDEDDRDTVDAVERLLENGWGWR
jgi:hypothetical protein